MSKLDYSKWREQLVTINPGEYDAIDFLDTKPNVFWIQNLNATSIYLAVGFIPDKNRYEHEITKMKSDVFGRPLPCNKLYFHNPALFPITVRVMSNSQEFDMALLKELSLDFEKMPKFDGEISGFAPGAVLPVVNAPNGKLNVVVDAFNTLVSPIVEIKERLKNNWTDGTFAEKNSTPIRTAIEWLQSHFNTKWADGSLTEKNSSAIKTAVEWLKIHLETKWTDGSFTEKYSRVICEKAVLTSQNITAIKDVIEEYADSWISGGSGGEVRKAETVKYYISKNSLSAEAISPVTPAGMAISELEFSYITNRSTTHWLGIRIHSKGDGAVEIILAPGETLSDFKYEVNANGVVMLVNYSDANTLAPNGVLDCSALIKYYSK